MSRPDGTRGPVLPNGHPRERYPRPDAEPAPAPPQRWQCAVCIGTHRMWEAAHQDDVNAAVAAAEQHPGTNAAMFLPPDVLEAMPAIFDAVTIATFPGAGTCAVCPHHTPLVQTP